MSEPQQKPGKSKQDYGTPPEFLGAVKRTFFFNEFDFDLAAHEGNKIVPAYYGRGSPLGENALSHKWSEIPGNLWLNPPFGEIEGWIEYANYYTMNSKLQQRIYVLTPASTDTVWCRKFVYLQPNCKMIFLSPRIKFLGGPKTEPYPKPLMLSVFDSGFRNPLFTAGQFHWDWREDNLTFLGPWAVGK